MCDSYAQGSVGALELAKKVIELANRDVKFSYLYDLADDVFSKIEKVSREIYRADFVEYADSAKEKIENLSDEFSRLPICIAKTPYSLSGDSKLIGNVGGYSIKVSDIKVNNGAGFIVVYLSSILTMPGLSKTPSLFNMDLLDDGTIIGLN